jgi:hypothetical protein
VPWCEDCAKFWNPNSMPPDGTCPTCGRVIAEPPDDRIPWHFWLLAGVAGVYLGWRAVQGIVWLVDNGQTVLAVVISVLSVALIAYVAVTYFRRVPVDDDAHAHPDAGGTDNDQ